MISPSMHCTFALTHKCSRYIQCLSAHPFFTRPVNVEYAHCVYACDSFYPLNYSHIYE